MRSMLKPEKIEKLMAQRGPNPENAAPGDRPKSNKIRERETGFEPATFCLEGQNRVSTGD